MATVRDLIKDAMKEIGAIASGETPSASEQTDALSLLNRMIGSWSNDGFMIYEEKREEFTLTSGTQSYTIGSGATFDTTRPQVVLGAGILLVDSNIEVPIRVLNQQEYQEIMLKSQESTIPCALYYNATYPNGTITLWPEPSAANKLVLYSLKPLSAFSSVSDTVSLPPGYEDLIVTNLAVRLCPMFGKAVTADLDNNARESKALISRSNTKPLYLVSDADGLTNRKTFNIFTGE